MNKLGKATLTGLAGLVLISGGLAAGAALDGWNGRDEMTSIREDVDGLSGVIDARNTSISKLKSEKSALETQRNTLLRTEERLNGELATITDGAQQLTKEFFPQYTGLPTKEQLVKASKWVVANPGKVSKPIKQAIAKMENDLKIATDENVSLNSRIDALALELNSATQRLASVRSELEAAEISIGQLNTQVTTLKSERDSLKQQLEAAQSSEQGKDDEITELEAQLQAAEQDAIELEIYTNGVLQRHLEEPTE